MFEKCFVNVGATIKANAKATEVVGPCVSTLDHPAKFAEDIAVLGPAIRDHRLDAAFAEFPAMWFGVVAAIGINDFGVWGGQQRSPRIGAEKVNRPSGSI